ncbi:siderophore-interacting protein [Rothia sp. AR01]|uniref:Siderophore-interacting protein n=1 Tax=Rothia santali TaxID=2949643 RepID=A0A9X2HFC4_9MICC|nr:siderophore-interacting protein [Rothia santali]MCP3424681.1 siderophore-interacting protein [Rothia santali]
MSHHQLIIHPLILRTVEVLDVEDVTPRMRRVRLGGEQLLAGSRDGAEAPAFAAPGFDDHVKLIFAESGPVSEVLPRQLENGIEWTDAPLRLTRDYTPRWVDASAGELALDFVMHGDGPAVAWAGSARPGDQLTFVGPKGSTVFPDGVSAVVMFGDETALPAIGRFLDERPTAAPAHIVVSLDDPRGRQDLNLGPRDTIHWLEGTGADGEKILAGVRARLDELAGEESLDLLLGETPFLWAAGEAKSLLPLRRWGSRELGLPKSRTNITGYWHLPKDEGRAGDAGAAPSLPASPVAWFALAAAVQTGALEPLTEAPVSTAGIAGAAGLEPGGLEALLHVLDQHGVVERRESAGRADWRLTELGRELMEDEHLREDFEPAAFAPIASLTRLPEALRGSGAGSAPGVGSNRAAGSASAETRPSAEPRPSAWTLHHGRTFARSAQENPELLEEVAEHAEALDYLQHAVFGSLDALGAERLAVTGPGAPGLHRLLEEREGAPAACRLAESPYDVPLEADGSIPVSVMWLHLLDDDAALAHLRALGVSGDRAVVIDSPRPDELSPSAAETALVSLAVTGRAHRTDQQLAELARAAGWDGVEIDRLGWGFVSCRLFRSPGAPTR